MFLFLITQVLIKFSVFCSILPGNIDNTSMELLRILSS